MNRERIMIPASRWHDNCNGTAWLVFSGDEHNDAAFRGDTLDRPCDKCEGFMDPDDDMAYCPDCIDGRHTWEMTVEGCGHVSASNHICRGARRDYWVSVVPGMVLPIHRYSAGVMGPFVLKLSAPKMSGHNYCIVTPETQAGQAELIRLPYGAHHGMWAVLLQTEAVT